MSAEGLPVAQEPEKAPPPDLAKLKRMFDDSREGMGDTRKLSEAARDYFDGKQLTAGQRRVLRLRKQPDVVVNRVRRAVEGILGIVEQGKSDPRALMRNPDSNVQQQPAMPLVPGMPEADEPTLDAGDVASMTLRFIADTNKFQALKMDALENMFVEGYGGCITEFVDDDVKITLIPSDEYFYDVKSRKNDFSDKRYDGIAKWMYADDLIAIFSGAKKEIEDALETGDAGTASFTGWEDKPDKTGQRPWIDRKSRRLMVVEMYHKEGGIWQHCVFHGGGVLDYGPSVYVDDKGRPMNPIETQAIYVARDLTRYGVVKDMIDLQDEINARRSKAIHEINTRQVQQTDPNAPPVDVDEVRKEASRPDGVIPAGWQVVPRNDVVANSIEMLQESKSELERIAPNPAILGRQGADSSGRAQQVRQQAGMTELSRPLGRFTDWENRIYAQAWQRARQFYTDPKWIRVTDDDGAPQYVRINEPAPVDPMTQQPMGEPKNHVAKMDVDIVVDSVPDMATLQQEIFGELVQLAGAYGPEAVPFEVLVEMSPLPKRRELIKKIEKAKAKAAQANAQMMQMQAADAQAKIEKTNSETKKNLATAQKTEIDATVAAMEGEALANNPDALLPPPPGNSGAPN